MPEIQIRPASAADLPKLVSIDHSYSSDIVWQMDLLTEEAQVGARFRQIRLPRSVRVSYPRQERAILDDWQQRSGILVALLGNEVVAYISLNLNIAPATTWVTDLAVVRRLRRQGIGSALVLAAQEWSRQHHVYRIILEIQPKNFPAISMAQKLGFDFCGYNDRYYANHDIALFFGKAVI
jgi:ribosomal protein S18 acetylase RimI-like enzyme